MFDVESFLQTTVTQALSTEYLTIPDGEYPAVVKDLAARQHDKEGRKSTILDITWSIDDPTVKAAVKRDNPTARQSVFLDLTPEGNLDLGEGMNVQLGRLRKAVGQNDNGRPWSFGMLRGAAGRVKVETTKDGEKTYTNVTGVRPF